MLRKILYSGINGQNKFVLVGFPETIDQATKFEFLVSRIAAVIYTSAKGPTTEIYGNDLSSKSIESLFNKSFRVKTMNTWDESTFEEHLGKRV